MTWPAFSPAEAFNHAVQAALNVPGVVAGVSLTLLRRGEGVCWINARRSRRAYMRHLITALKTPSGTTGG